MVSPGQRLGAYEVVSRLGRGGMASLFLGRRSGPADFSRFVALKVVHEEHAHDVKLIEMLLDEARMAVHVQHPNVVRVEELGEASGRPYLVMEYVDGVTLSAVLAGLVQRKQLLPIATAVHLAAEVAAGLHAAHDAMDDQGRPLGMVHRDVSPQNVMVSASGHVKVIDFGVAKAKGRLTRTAHGAIKGKLAYMAPEQVGGEAVDRRTDVFALGILLWEMLTRRRLFFSRDTAKTIAWIRRAIVVSPREHRPEIPPELEAIVLRALALEPHDRFPTALDLRRALLTSPSFHPVPASELAAMVKDAAADQLAPRKSELESTLVERTLISDSGAPLPVSPGALTKVLRAAVEEGDASAASSAAEMFLFAFGQPEVVESALGGDADRVTESVRARVAAHRGDLSEELRLRERVRRLTREDEHADAQQYAQASLDSAVVRARLGDYERAEKLLTKALAAGLRGTSRAPEARLLLGEVRIAQARFGEAEEDLDIAAEEAERAGRRDVLLAVAVARAACAFGSGRRVKARAEAEHARDLARRAHVLRWEVRALVEVSRAALATRDIPAALDAARQVERLAASQATRVDRPEVALVLAMVAEQDGRAQQAAAYRREARDVLVAQADRIADPEWRARFLTGVPVHAELLEACDA